jgi:hypothetical protein
VYEGEDTNAASTPLVRTVEEADSLGEPSIDGSPTLRRVLELAVMMADDLGPEVPVAVPDIQSPFDIAAMVWRKEDFYVACAVEPEAVLRLVGKCERLLTRFLDRYLDLLPNVNMCHCPRAWSPPDLGIWLSEDEVGAISPDTFERLSLPSLTRLSERYGGISIHCCARAEHQFPSFRKLPGLRAWQRVFADERGAQVALESWPETPFVVAWQSEEAVMHLAELAPHGMRFLLNMEAQASLDESRALLERLRQTFPRARSRRTS